MIRVVAPAPAVHVPQAVKPPQLARAHTTPHGSASGAAAERTFDPLSRLEPTEETESHIRVRAVSIGSGTARSLALHARIMASRGLTAADRALADLGLGANAAVSEALPRRGLVHKIMARTFAGAGAAADVEQQPAANRAAASSSTMIDYDAVFSGAAAAVAPKQLELLQLSTVGKIALLTNDRAAWVTTLACISGYDATALASVSTFWHERLTRPTLMAPLWMYYGRNEFRHESVFSDPSFCGSLRSYDKRGWKRAGLFSLIATQLRSNARADLRDAAGSMQRSPLLMQQRFIEKHVERAERRVREAGEASQRARRVQLRRQRTCARRCVVHPILCVGTIGCFALPVPLLIATSIVLSVQSAGELIALTERSLSRDSCSQLMCLAPP